MHFGDWGNAAKELALCGRAFVIAGCFAEINKNSLERLLGKLVSFVAILFSATMISFGLDHFLYAKEAGGLCPPWIPYHIFWIYFAGVPLVGSGIAIILKIKPLLIATLLGIMILFVYHSQYALRHCFLFRNQGG